MPTLLTLIGVAFWLGLVLLSWNAVLYWRRGRPGIAVLHLALVAGFFLLSWVADRLPLVD